VQRLAILGDYLSLLGFAGVGLDSLVIITTTIMLALPVVCDPL